MAIVKVVMDKKTNKLRVKVVGRSGFVRFPKHLRKLGLMYTVEKLKKGIGNSWIATGVIRRIMESRKLKYRVK